MSLILAKAAHKTAQARKTKNVVLQVSSIWLDANGSREDQILTGVDIKTGEEIKVHLGEPISEVAAANRTTIADLKNHNARSVKVGGFVRVDGLRTLPNGQYDAKFVKTIKRSGDDHLRHFFQMKARVFEPRQIQRSVHGENTPISISRVELMDDESPVSVSNSIDFKTMVAKMLHEGSKKTQGIGTNIVFMREGPHAKTYSFFANDVKNENDTYRKPTADEIAEQLSQKDMFNAVASLLDEQKGAAAVELLPGASHRVLGKTATSKEFSTQAGMFYKGKFKVVNPEGGELVDREAAGFRDTILGLGRNSEEANALWIVTSVAASLKDRLTLNGMEEATGLRSNTSQTQSAPQPAPAQNDTPAQSVPPASTKSAPVETVGDEMSLDDLLDDDIADEDLINRAAAAFAQQDMNG